MFEQLRPYLLLGILVLSLGSFFAVTNRSRSSEDSAKEVASLDSGTFVPQLKASYPDIVLVDPETAPPRIREQVMAGYRIMIDTQKYASEYAGDKLNCRNCHFQGGNTLGGKNGSISLVGVSHVYPRYSARAGKTISLGERINSCFEKSLNGRPMPLDGEKMQALLAYLKWISSPVEGHKDFPWLGLPKITADHKPDAAKGKALYAEHCAACHLSEGQGARFEGAEEVLNIPPLWGDDSFNKRAGMHNVETMAPFVLLNMPKENPVLSEEEALDVSQFIHNQPRP